ncbi:tetratricopeptide repeat protein [bacterium AH-315-C07]|nr:tetratricopeptide repeat protein [bacterium AH-315-C07]
MKDAGRYRNPILKILLILSILVQTIGSDLYATSKVDSLKALLNTDLNDTTRIGILHKLFWKTYLSRPDTALHYAQQHLQLAQNINEPKRIGWAFNNIGVIFSIKGDYPRALTNFFQALKIDSLLNNKRGIAIRLGNIGIVYEEQSNYPKALQYYFKALEMDSVMGNKKGIATKLGNIGLVYSNQSDYPKALQYYFKALEMDSVMLGQAQQSGNPDKVGRAKIGIARHLGNIGIVYKEQNDYPKALQYYFKALEMNNVTGNENGSATNLGNIGLVYSDQSDYIKALQYYFKALEMNNMMGNANGSAINLGNIGLVYADQNDYPKALQYYFKALEMYRVMGDKRSIVIQLGNIGSLYTKIKQYDKAEQYLQRSLTLSDSIGTLFITMTFENTISELYAQTNKYQKAYNHHINYTTLKDTIFGEEKTKEIGRVEMKHEMEMADVKRKQLEKERRRRLAEEINKRNVLQFSLISIGILLLFILVLYSKRLMALLPERILFIKLHKANTGFAMNFIFILILFETLLLFADPYIDDYTHGVPGTTLLLNALIACFMFPLNVVLEQVLSKRTGLVKPTAGNALGKVVGLVMLVGLNSFVGGKGDTTATDSILNVQRSMLNIQQKDRSIDSLMNIFQTSDDDEQKIGLLHGLTKKLRHLGEYDQSLHYANKGLVLSKIAGTQKQIADFYVFKGLVYVNQSDYQNALNNYSDALTIYEVINDETGIALSYGNIGVVYRKQSDYPKALQYYFKALEIDSVIGNKRGITRHLCNIGIVYREQSNYPKALQYFFKALEMDSVMGNKRGIPTKLANIGIVYMDQGDYPKALQYYFKALEIDSVMGNKKQIAAHLGNIGIVYKKQKNYRKALQYYFKAHKMGSVMGNKIGIAISLGNIGTVYSQLKQVNKAEQYLQRSLVLSDSIGTLLITMNNENSISELYAQTSKWQQAYEHHVAYSNAKDTIFGEEKTKELGRIEMKHEMEMAAFKRLQREKENKRLQAITVARENKVQYAAVFIGFFVMLSIILMLSRFLLPVWLIEFLTFVPFLILYELILVSLDPYIETLTSGAPGYRLMINVIIAGMLYPLQRLSEVTLKRRFYRKKRKLVVGNR